MIPPHSINRRRYVCDVCQHVHVGWFARCQNCNRWGLMLAAPQQSTTAGVTSSLLPDLPDPPAPAEVAPPPGPRLVVAEPSQPPRNALLEGEEPIALCDIEEETFQREKTGIPQLDNVLGGGLVAGAVLVLGGLPGSGKSSLVLQAADGLVLKTLYATGEETLRQAAERARRIDCLSHRIFMVRETDLDRVLAHARRLRAELVVIDSINTLSTVVDRLGNPLRGQPGSPSQVKECTIRLVDFAKEHDVSVWLIGHVTSDGNLAGPKTLAHLVDVVLEIENANAKLRILRCDGKNRFGPSDQVGYFEIKSNGLCWVDPPAPPTDDGSDDEESDT